MSYFPLLAIVVVAYNVVVFTYAGATDSTLFVVHLLSGAQWTFSVGDSLLVLGLVFLFVEIFKATRTSTSSIIDHVLSLVVFVICLIEFMVLPRAGNSLFFLIMLMSLIDVIAGFTVTISAARRDLSYDR